MKSEIHAGSFKERKPQSAVKIAMHFLFIVLIGIGITLVFNGFSFDSSRELLLSLSYGILITLILWKGNEYCAVLIDTKISWLDKPVTRLIIGLVVTLVYTVLSVSVLNYIFYNYLFNFELPFFSLKYIGAYKFPVLITLFIVAIMHARGFLISWRELAVREEQLKRETLSAQYENLKNQVNPHFLFNSLNALSTLVHSNPETAEKFIKQLSKVYRYVLDVQQKELVSLEEEIEFLNSYLYLEQIRFGNKLKINNRLKSSGSIKVAPLALQMLVENAIKHNIISSDEPLSVALFQEATNIVVENNLNRKKNVSPTTGLGLENIRSRYKYISARQLQIEDDGQKFTVRLPIIDQER